MQKWASCIDAGMSKFSWFYELKNIIDLNIKMKVGSFVIEIQ
jgi:hypothetical protein